MNAEQEQALKAGLAYRRVMQLRYMPVRGDFDAAHLKEIHRRIFQDYAAYGFNENAAGEFRQPTRAGADWMKARKFEVSDERFYVAYSRMDYAAVTRLNEVLDKTKPVNFKNMDSATFSKKMSKLYVELDYLHPFKDGNSRTLREFTRQLAQEAGYQLDWGLFNRTPHGRDKLYIARDLSVNALALPNILSNENKLAVEHGMARLGQNKNLQDIFAHIVRAIPTKNKEQAPPNQIKSREIER